MRTITLRSCILAALSWLLVGADAPQITRPPTVTPPAPPTTIKPGPVTATSFRYSFGNTNFTAISWSLSAARQPAGTAPTAGNVDIVRYVDTTSAQFTQLMQRTLNGAMTRANLTIIGYNAGRAVETMVFASAFLVSRSISGDAQGRPEEHLRFAYTQTTRTYPP
jgi:hypothetical protein